MNLDMIKKMVFLLALVSFLPLAACNTVAGLGEDIERGGDAIEETAEDAM